jgi:hypothetical protein
MTDSNSRKPMKSADMVAGILSFENVLMQEVQAWLRANKESVYISGKNMAILRAMAFDMNTRAELAKDYKITKLRILQIYYAMLKKACRIIKIEKANAQVKENDVSYQFEFEVEDAMLDKVDGHIGHARRLLNTSVFTILWNEKTAETFKENNINYFGELVSSYRKLYFAPKFGYKSRHFVEEELSKLGLKFINKDISPIKIEKPKIEKAAKKKVIKKAKKK